MPLNHFYTFLGLFLHIGYSVSDRYLIEGNSELLFQPDHISHKLGALMNGDSAEQVRLLIIIHFVLAKLISQTVYYIMTDLVYYMFIYSSSAHCPYIIIMMEIWYLK